MSPASRGAAVEGTQSPCDVLCGLQCMFNAIKYVNRGLVLAMLMLVVMCVWHQFRWLQCKGRMEPEMGKGAEKGSCPIRRGISPLQHGVAPLG